RQAGGGKLTRRKRDLTQLRIDRVAIVVDAGEIIVGADFLKLLERGELRVLIPEAQVTHRGGVLLNRLRREVLNVWKIALIKFIEPVCFASEGDIARNVREFFLEFAGRDDVVLLDCRSNQAAEDCDDD